MKVRKICLCSSDLWVTTQGSTGSFETFDDGQAQSQESGQRAESVCFWHGVPVSLHLYLNCDFELKIFSAKVVT